MKNFSAAMKREFNYLMKNGKLSDWANNNFTPWQIEKLYEAREAKIDGEKTASGMETIIKHGRNYKRKEKI